MHLHCLSPSMPWPPSPLLCCSTLETQFQNLFSHCSSVLEPPSYTQSDIWKCKQIKICLTVKAVNQKLNFKKILSIFNPELYYDFSPWTGTPLHLFPSLLSLALGVPPTTTLCCSLHSWPSLFFLRTLTDSHPYAVFRSQLVSLYF